MAIWHSPFRHPRGPVIVPEQKNPEIGCKAMRQRDNQSALRGVDPRATTCRHLSQPGHRPPWNFASGGHKAEGDASFHCLAATARSAVSFRVPHMKINPGCHAPLSLSITFMKILATRSLLFRPEFLSPTRCSPESEKQNRTIDASGPPPAEIVLGY